MAERKRKIQIKFWVTPEEKKMIRKKIILWKTANSKGNSKSECHSKTL